MTTPRESRSPWKVEPLAPLPGTENVVHVSSGVRITHVPTGLVEEERSERSQLRNREIALHRLRERLNAGE